MSDAWRQGTAAAPGHDRFFLQAHYARRHVAQRLLTTAESSHVAPTAERAPTARERTLIGPHEPFFYDG